MRTVICDIECNGLDPTVIWCIVCKDIKSNEIFTWTPETMDTFKDWVSEEDPTFVGHNFISFDAVVIKKLLGIEIPLEKIIDTHVLTRLCDSRVKKSGLEAWGEKLNYPKTDFDDWDNYSEEMLQYCINDVELNHKVYEELKRDYKDKKIPKSVSRDEHRVAQICQEIHENGFLFDEQKAHELLITLKNRKKELDDELLHLLVPLPVFSRLIEPKTTKAGGFNSAQIKCLKEHKDYCAGPFSLVLWPEANLNSQDFIVKHLVRWGWKPKNFTDKGNIQLKEWDLEDAATKIPQARSIAEWDLVDRRITMVNTWIDLCGGDDRVHGKIWHIGTWTHRAAHSDPNLAQVPANDKPYGHECRALWTVKEGNVLLGCDASGIQLRVLAHYIGDPAYSKEVVEGDIHTVHLNAIGEGTRDNAKTFIYAFLLGAGGPRIAKIYDKPDKYGYELKDRFLKRIPALKGMITKYKMLAKRGYVIGLDGRWIPVEDPYHTLAALLQGGETAIMRKAMILWTERAKHLDWMLVNWIHDEWQTEVKAEHAEELGMIQKQAIVDAGVMLRLKCPMDGKPKIGPNWSLTH